MARKSTNRTVQATISADLFRALEDHAWDSRRRLTQVVAHALEEYADKHGIEIVPADDDAVDAQPVK